MPETPPAEDDPSARIEKALSESQQREREELHADLERQRVADDRVIDALSNKNEQ